MSAKHPYYTEIYQRSFDAIVKNGWLSEILLALITDPLEAEDFAERLERTSPEALWILPYGKGERRCPAPIFIEDFKMLSMNAETQWRVTLAKWVMRFAQADEAVRSLIYYETRVGVWAACQVVREAMRFIPADEDRPVEAVIRTERWASAKGTAAEATKAGDAALECSEELAGENAVAEDSAYAAYLVSNSISYRPEAEYAVEVTAGVLASAYYKYESIRWNIKRDSELVRLREVVANACMTFPM